MIGKTLNHFKIVGRLGKGGMGEVFVAYDSKLKRKVALKVLPEEMATDQERLERFQREAEAIAALNHPNVVTIHSVEEAENIRFLTMELVEGKTLAEMISTTPMDFESYFGIVIPVAEGLSAAHQQGIIHRDLKPANIMVNKEGRVKILDFGLAKLNRREFHSNDSELATRARTELGVALGTIPYMSPEQALGQEIDARSDIFSFGIVLYQLSTGRLPFRGQTYLEMISHVIHSEPVFEPKSIPVELERIIRKCLEKNPDHRYSSMSDLLKDLSAVRHRLTKSVLPAATDHEASLHNLPVQVTTFIGREQELAELRTLLSSHRLVTLIGTGGSGKTRLALEAGLRSVGDFPDGVWQVSFAPITAPELVTQSIVDVLQATKDAEQPLLESLAVRLEGRELLLVMDNCEHVLDEAARVVHEILKTAPKVRMLATSRESLNVPGESVWAIPSLSFPRASAAITVENAGNCDAVRLFTDRALAREPRFALTEANVNAVAGICAQLDGIPLAIELAAARIKMMSADEIRNRLSNCFKVLTLGTRTSLPRHQTLRTAVDWSYDLLSSEEQLLFRRLACFTGGFDLEALESVCSWGQLNADSVLDHLTRLVDKSLVVSERSVNDQVRYRLLEPLRQYAMEKLTASGEGIEMARRHMTYFAALADRAYEQRMDPATSWLDRLEREHDNLRAALAWASQHDPQTELSLAGALAWFWALHSHYTEGRRWLRRVLGRNQSRTREVARALCGASSLAAFQGDYLEEREPAEVGLAIWRELGDKREIALALDSIGWQLLFGGDSPAALNAFEESLDIQKELYDERLINRATLNICQVLVSNFDVDRAEPMAQKCLPIAIKYDEPRDIHFAHHFLADCALIRGDVVAARKKYADSLRAAVRLGDRFEISLEIEGIAMSLAGMGRDAKALRLEGAVQAEHEALKSIVKIVFWDTLKERYLVAAENRIGATAAEKEKHVGRRMGFEAAIEHALDTESD